MLKLVPTIVGAAVALLSFNCAQAQPSLNETQFYSGCVIDRQKTFSTGKYVCNHVQYQKPVDNRSYLSAKGAAFIKGSSSLATSYYDMNGTFPGKVKIQFMCNSSDVKTCNKARNAYQNVADTMTSLLNLRQNVTILAQYLSFCQAFDECGRLDLLGSARPSQYWMMPGSSKVDTSYMYPQSLARQLTDDLPFGDSPDIIASFNSDEKPGATLSKFWFSGDGDIQTTQYDFEYVVLHEIIHGLGFLTSLSTYLPDPAKSNQSTIVSGSMANSLPLVSFNVNMAWNTKTGAPEISPTGDLPYIFDKFLVENSTGVPLSTMYRGLLSATEFGSNNDTMAYSAFLSKLSNSSQMRLMKKLYRLFCTKSSVRFQTLDGASGAFANVDVQAAKSYSSIMLETKGSFKAGTSVSHFEQDTFTNTADFLMRPSGSSGVTLDKLSRNKFPIGQDGLYALATLGYRLKDGVTSSASGTLAHPFALYSAFLGYALWLLL